MYSVIKSVITAGGYKLADLQYKIKRMYVRGDLTEEEMDELLSLASGGATPGAERPETIQLLKNLSDRVDALAAEVAALKGGTTEDGSGESAVYPAWKAWDGISDDYQTGAIVQHNGQLWQSVYPGQNVWEPGTVDERFWVVYTPDEGV